MKIERSSNHLSPTDIPVNPYLLTSNPSITNVAMSNAKLQTIPMRLKTNNILFNFIIYTTLAFDAQIE